MIEFFYTAINLLLLPFIVLGLVYRVFVGKEDLQRVNERFGLASISRPQGKVVWIHAASVGEAMSVSKLVDYLHEKKINILFTSYTLNSSKAIQKKYGNKVIHQFIPIENYFTIKLFLRKWKPSLAIFVESEFWPMIIYQTSKDVEIISLNTRISNDTRKNWIKLRPFVKAMLSKVTYFYPQSKGDLEFIKSLGFANAKYLGNIKYSVNIPSPSRDVVNKLSESIGKRPVITLFSSHNPEENIFIDIFVKLKNKYHKLLLIICPRHPERSEEITDILNKKNLRYAVRSKGELPDSKTEIYISNTIGELPVMFEISDLNIVGGSFNKDIGGHNPIEPAIQKKASLMGPHHYNFSEIVEDFKTKKAIFICDDVKLLEEQIIELLDNPSIVSKYGDSAYKVVKEKSKFIEENFFELEERIK